MLLHEKIIVTNDDYKNRINELTKEIKEYRSTKRKIVFRKGLCLGTWLGIAAASLLALPAITTGLAISVGKSPFIKDNVVRETYVKTEFNTEGEKKVSRQREPYEEGKSVVRYHTGWVENNEQYVLEISTYDATGISYNQIDECLRTNKNIENVLGAPVSNEEFTKDSITKAEKNEKSHYEGVIYSVDNINTIVTPQTDDENGEDFGYGVALPTLIGTVATLLYANFGLVDLSNKFENKIRVSNVFIEAANDSLVDLKEKKRKLALELKKNSD